MDPRQGAPEGDKGSSQERLGRWPAIGQEPEWNRYLGIYKEAKGERTEKGTGGSSKTPIRMTKETE